MEARPSEDRLLAADAAESALTLGLGGPDDVRRLFDGRSEHTLVCGSDCDRFSAAPDDLGRQAPFVHSNGSGRPCSDLEVAGPQPPDQLPRLAVHISCGDRQPEGAGLVGAYGRTVINGFVHQRAP